MTTRGSEKAPGGESGARSTTSRRPDRLSRDRIVDAATAILDEDADGSGGLTLRALTTRLSTGAGAIYHHVSTMDDLRAAAADHVLERGLRGLRADDPDAAIEAAALAIHEVMETHRWFAGQLGRDPVQPAAIRIWKTIGAELRRLDGGAVDPARGGSVLFRFILGSAVQHADGPGRLRSPADERDARERAAARVRDTDADSLTTGIAASISEHDDRDQFRDGVRTILRGLRVT
ncbi:TetR/AcrR family transcriptional regulator [Curtobacterium sp. RRHDQ66]|uniref:TetR/AcrR family transcriptional regulator n=1 Tax=Curtobacterium guangdongense TaxID=3413380 RepID=UPI003BF04584